LMSAATACGDSTEGAVVDGPDGARPEVTVAFCDCASAPHCIMKLSLKIL
jgi:hypothetical protein